MNECLASRLRRAYRRSSMSALLLAYPPCFSLTTDNKLSDAWRELAHFCKLEDHIMTAAAETERKEVQKEEGDLKAKGAAGNTAILNCKALRRWIYETENGQKVRMHMNDSARGVKVRQDQEGMMDAFDYMYKGTDEEAHADGGTGEEAHAEAHGDSGKQPPTTGRGRNSNRGRKKGSCLAFTYS